LRPNNALQQVVKILPGELNAPESIQVDRDGKILREEICGFGSYFIFFIF